MMRLEIDPDIRRARLPPPEFYSDARWFEALRERVFLRSWQFAGVTDGLDKPGAARPFTLLPQCLDEPLLLVRDFHGALHCLSNVCTHRGNLIVDEECELAALRCRYHGRRFHLDGTFAFMPGFEEAEDFPSEQDYLARAAVAAWRGLLFASVRPSAPADRMIEPVERRLDGLGVTDWTFDPASARDYEIDANWALYVENYSEGFHVPFVHPSLAPKFDLKDYRTETWENGSMQIGAAAPGEVAFEPPPGHPDHGQRVAGYFMWLFPNTLLNVYPWGLSLNVVQPLGPSRTRIRFLSFVADPAKREQGAGSGLHAIELEDEAIVQNVQRGMRSRLAAAGRYSPRHEIGVHHFHVTLAKWLAG